MKKLTRKIVALTLSLVMCISFSNTTFAYADNENISSSAEASKVNWWKIGWIILSDYVEKLIDLDGQSEKDSSWAYLVSPIAILLISANSRCVEPPFAIIRTYCF